MLKKGSTTVSVPYHIINAWKICTTLSQGCLICLIQKRCISEIIFDNQLWFDLNATLTHYNCQLKIYSWRLFWNYGCWYLFCKHLIIYHWILSKTYFQLEIRNPDPYRHTNRLHVYGVYCECVYYFTWNKYLTHSHFFVKTIQQPHKYSIWYFVFVYHKMIYDQKKNFILKKYMNFKVKKWFSFLLVEEATTN